MVKICKFFSKLIFYIRDPRRLARPRGQNVFFFYNTSLVTVDMMTKAWNFVTKKIADGVNKFLSFFCLVLTWCVCMIFSKISLVTSHGASPTSLLEIHRVEKSTNQRRAFTLSTVSWFSELRKPKTPGWSVRQCSGDVSLGNGCKNELQTHTQVSLYDTYFKHGIGWHTTRCGKGYCQRYDDFQKNDGHFIGDWLNIV